MTIARDDGIARKSRPRHVLVIALTLRLFACDSEGANAPSSSGSASGSPAEGSAIPTSSMPATPSSATNRTPGASTRSEPSAAATVVPRQHLAPSSSAQGPTTTTETGRAPASDAGPSAPPSGSYPAQVNADAAAHEAGDASATPPPLSVMTFNIRYDNGQSTSGVDAWNATDNPRRERVVRVISDVNPDLLGVQEALKNQVDDLSGALSGYGFAGVGRDDGATRGEYAGVFYRLARFSLVDSGTFWLSETPDVPGTVFEGSGSIRVATWIVAEDLLSGRKVLFLNTHWDNVSQSSRLSSAELIREQFESLGADNAILMTGDLNQNESDGSVRALLAELPNPQTALSDAYREVHPRVSGDELTYHDFSGATAGSRIDFVLHDAHFNASEATIHRDSYEERYPSDHYAVSAHLLWLKR